MDKKARLSMGLLNWLWYLVFLLGINGYVNSRGGIVVVVIVGIVFKSIEYFFSDSKLSVFVKVVTILAIIFRAGNYINFFSPMWVYDIGLTIGNEINYMYFGRLEMIQVVPVVFNILFFIIFKEIVIAKRASSSFILLITFLGGALLLFLAIWAEAVFSLTAFLFVLGGIIKLFFNNMNISRLKPTSNTFTTSVLASLVIGLLIIWNLNLPVVFAEEFEWLKTQIEGGYTSIETGSSNNKGIRQTGYSSNDNRLGGSVEYSRRPVLTVKTEQPIYLRGETKYIYTGLGWTDDIISKDNVSVGEIPFVEFPQVEYQTIQLSVEILNGTYPVIFSGLNTTELKISRGTSEITSIQLVNGNDLYTDFRMRPNDSYQVTIQRPSYSQDVLLSSGSYPEEFPFDLYTDLPEDLPFSVREIAMDLTDGMGSNYEKAVAIRDYLRGSQFTYSLDVDYPPGGMDFVEHFLATKEGYCVHYSTAFVVMARAVDIPARWVKGFTQGDISETGVYTVYDKDAHAWAEIYIPNAGWVAFEPTKGFRAPQASQGTNQSPIDPDGDVEDPATPIQETPNENVPGDTATESKTFDLKTLMVVFAGSILLLFVSVIWKVQKNTKSRLTANDKVIILYNKVIGKLKILGAPKKNSETPREFITRSGELGWIPKELLNKTTQLLERAFYGENIVKSEEVEIVDKENRKTNTIYLGVKKTLNHLKLGRLSK
ncbi:transglutaminase domain-containing protein [Alkalicella caledoniensis]|uniref:Transglutaminase domain-containing protein n=1 Tax=Alkalicella caledoniensis TaxID=2731377 RepID=A0A7G9W965_ALKCA|nr:transglutaminase domain-containing protein [Alkalicella caledoniensis]QNO15227.1 transglutaminase domain-containing protein [Alkalicella caledoniensis]